MTQFRTALIVFFTFTIASFAIADESPHSLFAPRLVKPKQAHVAPPAAPFRHISPARFQPEPFYETVSYARLEEYKTQNDVPNYDQNNNGNGTVLVAGGTAPRSDYAIGIEGGRMQGGGCFPVDPSQPNTCVQETDVYGNAVTVQKMRERWSFRLSYIDPSTPGAAEVNVGFGTNGLGSGGDSVWEWDRGVNGHHSCFTFYPCDVYGFNLNEIEGTVQWQNPNCAMKLGAGYHVYLLSIFALCRGRDDPLGRPRMGARHAVNEHSPRTAGEGSLLTKLVARH